MLTGGADRPYALGLTAALTGQGMAIDFIGSDDLNLPELRNNHLVNFINLRGDQNPGANLPRKVARILTYYWRLIRYAATAKPKVFHILWNNKFELFDRTLLMLYYKLFGKKLIFTAHNVNIRKRDCTRYGAKSVFVESPISARGLYFRPYGKNENGNFFPSLAFEERKVSVIPFGINNTVPNTELTSSRCEGYVRYIHQRQNDALLWADCSL